MSDKPTYEELYQRVQELEKKETKLKKLEKELQASQYITERNKWEPDFRNIFEMASDMLCVANPSGEYIKVSPSCESILGYTPNEVMKLGWNGLVHPDDIEPTRIRVEKQLEGSVTVDFVNRYRHKDGSYKSLEWNAAFTSDGYVYGAGRDITERKQAEDALRESKQKLQSMVENIGIGVALISKNMEILELNRKMREWFPDTDLRQRPICHQAFNTPPRDLICSDCPTIKTFQDGKVHESITKTLQTGGYQNYRIVSSPIFDEHGEVTTVIEMIEDMTEQMALEAHLRQAQKMESIGNLAGGIAHDFNNILSSIIGFTELALEAAPEGSAQKDDLEEVCIAGNRARELVQQILSFARQSEKETKPTRFSDIVTEVLKLLRPSTPTSIDIKPIINSTAKVMGNDSQLHQIVMNICTNAIHSLQKSGDTLEITLRNMVRKDSEGKTSKLPSDEYVELIITDNGPGIDPAIIENIFEPYFTTKGVGEGSGMGLAMVKGIVESYGGDIHVKSELGKKTSFAIRLPVTTGKRYEDLAPVDPVASGTERILFVDDEPPIARMGSRMLESLGYTATIRTSSFEALALFQEKPDAFDLIITDMTMPGMTGDELSIEIRKIRRDIPIILCTGYSNKINDEGAKQIGIDAFAYKPCTKPDLAKTIRKVLDAE